MYRVRTESYSKRDPEKRWALPDRIFFACGACHVLAHAFLERHGRPDMRVLWIKPEPGFKGEHIVVATPTHVFDYHGYSRRERYFAHTWARARQWWPNWNASIVEVPRDVLISEKQSRQIHGLWLREPGQFLHDAMPRARAYLDRFQVPCSTTSI